ncbi:hypothetical protein [Marixanthomonas spongiae]|uniref:hypothetical protein n=1 Tax=Marixanthomonas spongiae TaxID=2174845 RepID=UPI001403BE9E|nr:hypothetical protein [Marixanthomonas spongiae]
METNSFNICPTCLHRNTCVLTEQKSQVWSCSEYDEAGFEGKGQPQILPEMEYEMATH